MLFHNTINQMSKHDFSNLNWPADIQSKFHVIVPTNMGPFLLVQIIPILQI